MEIDTQAYAQMQREKDEYDYYTVVFEKQRNLYVTDPTHPLLKKVAPKLNIVNGQAVFNQKGYELIKEKLIINKANILER